MRFTDIFIQRPVLALVVSALILLLGLQAWRAIPVSEFPLIEDSVIEIRTVYPGASAQTVQGFVTTPLQQKIASAQGIDYLSSNSMPGMSSIDVHIRLGFDSDDALSQVIAKINEAKGELPDEVKDPVVTIGSGSGGSMMYLWFLSDELSTAQVTDYLVRAVQPAIATLEGVGSAELGGAKYYAMRIWLQPAKMAEFGVTAEDISDAIRKNNYISAAGDTQGDLVMASVRAKTDLDEAELFGDIVVKHIDDRRVRLRDVADLELGAEDTTTYASTGGKQGVFVEINPAPGANPLYIAQRVRNLMPELLAKMPGDMTGFIQFDAAIFIQESIQQVAQALLEAVLIVTLVIFLFLGSTRVVAIPVAAIPLSLIGVLFLIYSAGFTLNLLTMLALVLAIGLVVDDAIVVVENVHRHIENDESPYHAALHGAREIAWPVIAMTLTLAAVFAPMGFLGGLTGQLFIEFAFTLAGAVIVSGIVALTLSPMMCSKMLVSHSQQGRLADTLDQWFENLRHHYHRLLEACLQNTGAVILFCVVIIASLPIMFQFMQKELAPIEDQGIVFVFADKPVAGNVDYFNRFTQQYTPIFKAFPEYDSSFQINDSSMSMAGFVMKPWSQRERTQQEVLELMQPDLAAIGGLEIYSFGGAPLPGGSSGLNVQFVISATSDYQSVQRVAEQVMAEARKSGLFMFVQNSLKFNRPEVVVSIDRAKAARLGISMESIGETLSIMLGEGELNRFSSEGRSYKVIPQAAREFRLTKEWLERYYLRTSSGDLVPLSTVISLDKSIEPNSLRQFQQMNSATIRGMVMPGHTLGEALDFLTETTQAIAPPGFRIGYTGESRQYMQEKTSIMGLFGVSVVVIFLVLAAQFNSFKDPAIIMVSVPMSVFGAAIPIVLGMTTFNIYTQVGLLTLVGLITKHGILIIDFANHRLAEGMTTYNAVIEAASQRLRPILMTTAATVLGVIPLLTAFGAGANSRFSIGVVITWGMLVGTLFTLLVIPSLYLIVKRVGNHAGDNKTDNDAKANDVHDSDIAIQSP